MSLSAASSLSASFGKFKPTLSPGMILMGWIWIINLCTKERLWHFHSHCLFTIINFQINKCLLSSFFFFATSTHDPVDYVWPFSTSATCLTSDTLSQLSCTTLSLHVWPYQIFQFLYLLPNFFYFSILSGCFFLFWCQIHICYMPSLQWNSSPLPHPQFTHDVWHLILQAQADNYLHLCSPCLVFSTDWEREIVKNRPCILRHSDRVRTVE